MGNCTAYGERIPECMLTSFPQCNFSLEFPEILRQNHISYHRLGVSEISKIMHCGILIQLGAALWECCLTD